MKKLFLIILFVSKAGFANDLPELGSHFDNLLTQNDEKKITFQILSQVYQSNNVINDSEINNYIERLGSKLSMEGTDDKLSLKFFIIDDPSINAFAMLGGIIGIHTGLIFAANTESELSSVLSHEIAHITQKHLLRLFDSQARNSFKSYLALAIAILAARSNPQVASGAIVAANAAQVQSALDFTRENEKEADRVGIEILNKSGFDPKGFIDFFRTLQRFNTFSSGAAPSFLRTHPITSDRISDIQDRLKEFRYVQKESNLEFYLIKAKLQAFLGDKELIVSIFEREINDKTSLNLEASLFGLSYAYLRKNDVFKARKTFNLIKNLDNPMFYQLEATILVNEKKYEEAYKVYKDALEKYANNISLIIGKANLLINSKQAHLAIEFLKKYVDLYPSNHLIYESLAKSYSVLGKKLLEHENLANAFYYKYDIQEAVTQMDLATKANDGNFYEKSRVEFRLNELKREADLLIN